MFGTNLNITNETNSQHNFGQANETNQNYKTNLCSKFKTNSTDLGQFKIETSLIDGGTGFGTNVLYYLVFLDQSVI